MSKMKSILVAAVAGYLAQSTASLADWFSGFDGQVALSAGEEIAFSCPPPGVDFIGPTFEVYFSNDVPALSEPNLVFEFGNGRIFEWKLSNLAELYVGPMENPYGSDDEKGNTARLAFGVDPAATELWQSIAEDFMNHDSVTIVVNGVALEPVSLQGSSKAFQSIICF